MPRRSAPVEVVEISGDVYPDLETVQAKALPLIAGQLTGVLRDLLESGALIVQGDKIIINPGYKR